MFYTRFFIISATEINVNGKARFGRVKCFKNLNIIKKLNETKQFVAESAILDARCYLEGGGSAENLIAGEDLKLGSELGKLRINGDPSVDGGDIKLSVREKDAPVSIAPGTKTLVLTAALDKEGVKGHSSIYVNIICDRRHSNDPVRRQFH